MFTRTTTHWTHHAEVETLVRWAILLVLAAALMLVWAAEAGGSPPAADPAEPATPAVRIPAYRQAEPPYPQAWAEPQPEVTDWERAHALWRLLELHARGEHAEAAEGWTAAGLPADRAHWQWIARGYSALAARDTALAETLLEQAGEMAPNHPMPHYLLGLTHLRQAAEAREYYDNAGPDVEGFVAAVPSRARLMRQAEADLRTALELGPMADEAEPLLAAAWVVPSAHALEMPMATPTAMDLMEALGVEDYEADAYWRLGAICLDSDRPEEAERHWDAAADGGRSLRVEYRMLARHYTGVGDDLGAARAHLKAMRHGGPYTAPASDATQSFFRALMAP